MIGNIPRIQTDTPIETVLIAPNGNIITISKPSAEENTGRWIEVWSRVDGSIIEASYQLAGRITDEVMRFVELNEKG